MRLLAALVVVVAALVGPTASAQCVVAGDVLINEFLPNPDGTDTEAEWVELHNVGSADAELEGWTIEAGTRPTSLDTAFTLPAYRLFPGDFVVVAGPLAAVPAGPNVITVTPEGTLGNASSSSDAVRLVDCDGVVRDVVAYGPANETDHVFDDESGVPIEDARLAPGPGSGESLGRAPDGADTDDGAVDFVVFDPPTPGVSNASEPAGETCDYPGMPGDVVINEFLANPEGTDGGQEWIELFNDAADEVDLSGWRIEQAGSPDDWGSRVRFTFEAGTTIAAGAHLLVHEDLFSPPGGVDAIVLPEEGRLSLGNSQDGVRLTDCAGDAMDTVIYGGSNPDGFEGDLPGELDDDEVGPAVAEAASLARRADGLDSDDSGVDFVVAEDPTPGEENEDLRCKGTAGEVFINEFLANPAGADGDARTEFVELYNAGSTNVDLSTWVVSKVTSVGESGPNETVLAVLPPGTNLGPGAFFVVGGVLQEVLDLPVEDFDLGSGANGDVVQVVDCEGEIADRVLYGEDNDDGLEDDDGSEPDVLAPKPGDDQCLFRPVDGEDSDVSADDFALGTCTPGASNGGDADGGGEPVDGPAAGCSAPKDRGPVTAGPGGCDHVPWSPMGGLGLVLLAGLLRRR